MSGRPSTVRFHPADPSRARALTADQIEQYNALGYISPLDALTPEETAASRAYFESLLEKVRAFNDGRDAYSIMSYHTRCQGIWDLALHPVILDYVEDLLGPDFVCWTSHYFCKLPGDSKRVPWHQDATYWPVRPTKTVTVWLAIDDVDRDNSPMRFVSGSHRHGRIRWQEAEGDYVLYQEIPNAEDYGDRIFDNVLEAGQISLHASTLVHGSEPNTSDRRRCGLTLRYIPSDCGVKDERYDRVLENAVIARGAPGQWRVNERPAGDDLRKLG